jgi:hypothetical protein
MSIEWMNTVMNRPEPLGTARMVLLILADRADENGVCWPGVDYVAKRAAVSGRTVQRALQSLEDGGWLIRNTNAGPAYQGNFRPNLYQLTENRRGDTGGNRGDTGGNRGDTGGSLGVTLEVARGDNVVTQSVSDPSEIHQRGDKPLPLPSLEEWLIYCSSIDYSDADDAEGAFNHYEAVGWRSGKTKIRNWRGAARTCKSHWIKRSRESGLGNGFRGEKIKVRGQTTVVTPFDSSKPFAHTGGVMVAGLDDIAEETL